MIFYGIELELFQIDESSLVLNFRIVVGPSPSKKGTIPSDLINSFKIWFKILPHRAGHP